VVIDLLFDNTLSSMKVWSPTHDHDVELPNKLDFSPTKKHQTRERTSLNTALSRELANKL
jgi:hypothetical protein